MQKEWILSSEEFLSETETGTVFCNIQMEIHVNIANVDRYRASVKQINMKYVTDVWVMNGSFSNMPQNSCLHHMHEGNRFSS